jgi:hypothetical protein
VQKYYFLDMIVCFVQFCVLCDLCAIKKQHRAHGEPQSFTEKSVCKVLQDYKNTKTTHPLAEYTPQGSVW